MSTTIVQTTENPLLEPVCALIRQHGELGKMKIFDGLYTAIAFSESGFIGIYWPYIPYRKGSKLVGLPERQEQLECLEVIHISQVNSFDFDVDEEEEIKSKTGFGGAVVGGLVGGATGAIIGSAARSGKIQVNTKINGIDLIINTKDFGKPRIVVPLYRGAFDVGFGTASGYYPAFWRAHCEAHVADGPMVKKQSKTFKKTFKSLFETIYNKGRPPIDRVGELESTLEQMMAAHEETLVTSAAVVGSADELLKFKELLDSGVITQEEFDAKKKQLLGL